MWLGDFNNDTLIDIIGFKDDGVYIGYGKFACSDATRNVSTSCACIPGTFDNGDGLVCPCRNFYIILIKYIYYFYL